LGSRRRDPHRSSTSYTKQNHSFGGEKALLRASSARSLFSGGRARLAGIPSNFPIETTPFLYSIIVAHFIQNESILWPGESWPMCLRCAFSLLRRPGVSHRYMYMISDLKKQFLQVITTHTSKQLLKYKISSSLIRLQRNTTHPPHSHIPNNKTHPLPPSNFPIETTPYL